MALQWLNHQQMQNELPGMTLKELYAMIDSGKEDLYRWLQSMGILHVPCCPICQGGMTERFTEKDDGFVCYRRACRSDKGTMPFVSARKGSFFEKSHLPIDKILLHSYFWTQDLGLFTNKEFELGISPNGLVQWEQYFRDVCAEFYKGNQPVLGGPGCIVEIDETLVAKRKYNKGRYVRRHQWLFGGIERGSGRSFLKLVKKRDAATLIDLITTHIRPGTTIHSDCWRAYANIASLPQGFQHFTVNHQLNFVDPRSGAHTQTIESHWQKLKSGAKKKYGINNARYEDYLSEFLWKEQFGQPNEVFYNFWKQVADLYPP